MWTSTPHTSDSSRASVTAGSSRSGTPSGSNWPGSPRRYAANWPSEPETDGWTDDDLLMLAGLYVDQMLMTASLFLEALDEPEEDRLRVTRLASRRMRLISIGCRHWLD